MKLLPVQTVDLFAVRQAQPKCSFHVKNKTQEKRQPVIVLCAASTKEDLGIVGLGLCAAECELLHMEKQSRFTAPPVKRGKILYWVATGGDLGSF